MENNFLESMSDLTRGIFQVRLKIANPDSSGVIVLGNEIFVFHSEILKSMYFGMPPQEAVYHVLRHVVCGDYHRVLKHKLYGAPYVPCKICYYHQPLLRILGSKNPIGAIARLSNRMKKAVKRNFPKQEPSGGGDGVSTPSGFANSSKRERKGKGNSRLGTHAVDFLLRQIDEVRSREEMLRARIGFRNLPVLATELKKAEVFGRAAKIGFSRTDYSRPQIKRVYDFLSYRRRGVVEPTPVIMVDVSGSMELSIESATQQINSLNHQYPIKVYAFDTKLLEPPLLKQPHSTVVPPVTYGGTRVWTCLMALYEREPNASTYFIITDCDTDDWDVLQAMQDSHSHLFRRTTVLLVDGLMTTERIEWLESFGFELKRCSRNLGETYE